MKLCQVADLGKSRRLRTCFAICRPLVSFPDYPAVYHLVSDRSGLGTSHRNGRAVGQTIRLHYEGNRTQSGQGQGTAEPHSHALELRPLMIRPDTAETHYHTSPPPFSLQSQLHSSLAARCLQTQGSPRRRTYAPTAGRLRRTEGQVGGAARRGSPHKGLSNAVPVITRQPADPSLLRLSPLGKAEQLQKVVTKLSLLVQLVPGIS